MFNNGRSILEVLKRSAWETSFVMSFTLRKRDYARILDRIKKRKLNSSKAGLPEHGSRADETFGVTIQTRPPDP